MSNARMRRARACRISQYASGLPMHAYGPVRVHSAVRCSARVYGANASWHTECERGEDKLIRFRLRPQPVWNPSVWAKLLRGWAGSKHPDERQGVPCRLTRGAGEKLFGWSCWV